MEIKMKNEKVYKNSNVLVRIYENQNPNREEDEQIVGDIYFKDDRSPVFFKAWLPQGALEAIKTNINKYCIESDKICIDNQLPNIVGVLTSVKTNMDLLLQKIINH